MKYLKLDPATEIADLQASLVCSISATEPRDVLVERYNRVVYASRVMGEAYQVALSTLVTLHNRYLRSKEVKNVINRYAMLRDMIKVSDRHVSRESERQRV
jgi:hypothetical protein